mmetsp:Transcript_76280/g.215905  ORF Transcript_76280/g.215905 Transcript_76280/m.215905 type:complete len:628 (-) Transcript_76280:173-2056(-)
MSRALALLALLRGVPQSWALCGGLDTSSLVQGAVQVQLNNGEVHSDALRTAGLSGPLRRRSHGGRQDPFEASTIGDIAPRILSDDAIVALKRFNEKEVEDGQPAEDNQLNEATAETLAAAIGSALNRITARLDVHLTKVIQLKEVFLQSLAVAPNDSIRLTVFESTMNETLDSAQQGTATVAVVLRSIISSTEASLESAGQRDLAAEMESALGGALSRFDRLSQTAFHDALEHVAGMSQETDSATQRLTGLRESLRTHRREANALGHALYQQFQGIVSAIIKLVESRDLPAVAVHRVKTAFTMVQESAAAIAWKLYLPAWELATGVGVGSSELGIYTDEPAAESVDEPFGGEMVTLEMSPFKPRAAKPVTRELDAVEQQVDVLMSKTMAAREGIQRAVAEVGEGRSSRPLNEVVASAMASVQADWAALGKALGTTARSITQCLDTAGQHEVSQRLSSMLGDALLRSSNLAHLAKEPAGLSAALEAFLQRQDALAQSFFRTYHEFMTGMSHTPDGGVTSSAISLRRWRTEIPQKVQAGEEPKQVANFVGICAALGSESVVPTRLQDTPVLQLDQDAMQEDEAARRMVRRAQEVAFGSVQQAAAIAWKIHSAAWVLVSGVRKAVLSLIG